MKNDFNAKQHAMRDLSLPLIKEMHALSNGMNQAYAPFIEVDVKDQDPLVGINEHAPLRVINVTSPEDRTDLYARVCVFGNQDGSFDFLVYNKELDDHVAIGSAEEIKPVLLDLVKGRIQERNMALIGRDYDIAELRIER